MLKFKRLTLPLLIILAIFLPLASSLSSCDRLDPDFEYDVKALYGSWKTNHDQRFTFKKDGSCTYECNDQYGKKISGTGTFQYVTPMLTVKITDGGINMHTSYSVHWKSKKSIMLMTKNNEVFGDFKKE